MIDLSLYLHFSLTYDNNKLFPQLYLFEERPLLVIHTFPIVHTHTFATSPVHHLILRTYCVCVYVSGATLDEQPYGIHKQLKISFIQQCSLFSSTFYFKSVSRLLATVELRSFCPKKVNVFTEKLAGVCEVNKIKSKNYKKKKLLMRNESFLIKISVLVSENYWN